MLALLSVWLGFKAGAVAAEPDEAEPGEAERIDPALPHAVGRVFGAGTGPTRVYLLSAGGYGYTESVLGLNETHHRFSGDLSVEGRPLSWLGLALRVEGRYDLHLIPGQPHDDGLVGDPRFFVRVDHSLAGALRLGARAGLWLPGRNAPSFDLGALSPELVGAMTYAPAQGLFAASVNVGYRLDRSGSTGGDAPFLSASDRLALEVSAFNEVLVGAALTVGRDQAQGFLEASSELLVGKGAPSLQASPIWIGAGARYSIGRSLRIEAEAEISPSARPDLATSAPLVPVPPRVAVSLGLAYRFGSDTPPPSATPPEPPSPPPPDRAPPPPSPPPAVELRGHLSTADGAPLVDARVTVAAGDEQARTVAIDDDGRFTLSGRAGQVLTVEANATGYKPATETVTLAAAAPAEMEIVLQRRLPNGQVRGLVRSFKGVPLDATILIDPIGQESRAVRGHFQVDVPPGSYEITISSPGYETQHRHFQVEQNGVTLLNVDLRPAP